MCKECKVPANGDKMHYNSFDELTDGLINKFQSREQSDRTKKAYVDFINKLNLKGDELLSDYINTSTKVRIHYGKCGHTHPEGEGVTPDNYKIGRGCGICHGFIVVEGINDLATTYPHIAKEWHPTKNGDLKPTRVSYGSKKRVWWLCLDCGYEWEAIIANRTSKDTKCPNCGDGISYPEKLMALVLEKLGVEFTRQLPYNNGEYKYDFYVALWKAIFETHGIQHYEGWNKDEDDLLRQETTDKNKRYNAIYSLNLGIRNEDYNEVDCRYSTLEWCRPNIEKALSKYIDTSILTDEDWKELDKQAQKSLKVKACLCWKEQKEVNKDLTPTIMAEIFKVDKVTIHRWLTWGNESGMCMYSGKEERKATTKRLSKFVYLIKPNGIKWYNEAMSQGELARLTGINSSVIGVRRKDGKPLNGCNAKYDSKYIGCYIVNADEWDAQHN